MDEPLASVDPARLGRYWDAIRLHCARTATSLVFASHSTETVLREAQLAICLAEGRVLYVGDIQQLYHRPATRQLAQFLGPANWFTPAESRRWLAEDQQHDRCFRPEQVVLEKCDGSRLIVQSSRFAGSIAEVELAEEGTEQRRSVFHRPRGNMLVAGDHVSLKICLNLLFCFFLLGCGRSGTQPQLTVQQIKHWSMPPHGPTIPAPRAIEWGPENTAYVLDNAGRVLVFAADGILHRQWSMPETEIGNPEGLCIFRDGRVAVADTHYNRIVMFDQNGFLLGMQGELGKQPGQFIYPVAIAQDAEQNYYVCEYGENDRVQKFSVDGKFLLQFGSFGTRPGQFQRPSGIVWHQGKIYVADAINNRIQAFSDMGEFLTVLGSNDKPLMLHYPYDLAQSVGGDLYVIEYGSGRISRIGLDGSLVGLFGTTGSGKGQFSTPWGLAVDAQGRILVADTGNRRIVELRQ